MKEERIPNEGAGEISGEMESENEVTKVIEQQGDDANAGILRDTNAGKQEKKKEDNQELQGAP
jgi:hypothetical protein